MLSKKSKKKVHGLEKHMINLRKVRELEKVQDECEVGNCVKLKDANNKKSRVSHF